MTTITINKKNVQNVIDIIMQKIERWDMLIDIYDDVWTINYHDLLPIQKKEYDDVDLIPKALYTDA